MLGDGLGAHFSQAGVVRGKLGCFLFAALFLVGRRSKLPFKLRDALSLTLKQAIGLLEVGVGVAAAFFKPRERGSGGACGGLKLFAIGP